MPVGKRIVMPVMELENCGAGGFAPLSGRSAFPASSSGRADVADGPDSAFPQAAELIARSSRQISSPKRIRVVMGDGPDCAIRAVRVSSQPRLSSVES